MSDRSARRVAALVLDEALASRAPLDSLLDAAWVGLERRDRALLRELVAGSLRWLRRLDHVLAAASSRPLERIEPKLLAPLRVAAYQLLFLDRVPAYAAVNEAVEEARRRGSRRGAGFVNGVLRAIGRAPELESWPVESADPLARLAIETSHPELLVRRWTAAFGERRTRQLLEANNRPAPLQLLAFSDRGGAAKLAGRLEREGVSTRPAALSPLGLVVRSGDALATRALAEGDAYVQDQASQAAAWVPPPAAGERVLDLAAAPGGKSFATLAREPSARIVALDVSPKRAQLLAGNARRLGRRLPIAVGDAARPGVVGTAFDRVLVDLPCTGTGTLRRHPELKWRLSEREISRLAEQAWSLLRGAADLVAPGRLLVASTCSLEPEENEELVGRLLRERPEFSPEPLAGALPQELEHGVTAPGRWQVLTGQDHDGFTVHALRRS